jgi:hypothetical protein
LRRLRAFHHNHQNPIYLNIPLSLLSFSPIIICVENTVGAVHSWLYKCTSCYKFVFRHVHWLVIKMNEQFVKFKIILTISAC